MSVQKIINGAKLTIEMVLDIFKVNNNMFFHSSKLKPTTTSLLLTILQFLKFKKVIYTYKRAFTYSKLTIETLTLRNVFKVNNTGTRTTRVLVSLFITLNIFHTFL